MITITRSYTFEAAHFLPYVPEGHKCKNMHGHNYKIEVTYLGKGLHGGLNDLGWVMDFADIDAKVEPLLKLLDHKIINDQIPNPTAELIAVWIGGALVDCYSVRVYETDRCWADFYPEKRL